MTRHVSNLTELDAKLTAKITHGFARIEESHSLTRRILIGIAIVQTIFNTIFISKLFF